MINKVKDIKKKNDFNEIDNQQAEFEDTDEIR